MNHYCDSKQNNWSRINTGVQPAFHDYQGFKLSLPGLMVIYNTLIKMALVGITRSVQP